ncbi:PTPRM [Bugula neritina]|uniref:PTPRM n=1 Tax=Bugula neritina TaxID=10212 RepID=A0A7J7JIC6_BUGNE|nr:PTPRM [Bugula neritina]
MFTVSVTSLEADDCVSSVTLTYQSGQLSNQMKTGPWTFTKQQGVTFELTIKVELLDGHDNIIWQEEYTTSKAPNSSAGLTVDTRTSTSVTISWSPVDYTDKIYSIQQYQVTCITTNNTFNDNVTVNSVSYYNTSDSSTTSLTIESLHSQVEYSCTVKALLSENEFGESSREVVFWTKPDQVSCQKMPLVNNKRFILEPMLTYSNDNIVSSGEEAITVPLPNITSSDDILKGYDFLVIVVEKLSSRKKRSITVDNIDNVTVYITASFPVTNYSSSLSVGDNQIYGGYWNRPLDNQYSYHIAVGFKAKTEDDVLKFTTIPGAESVRLTGAPPPSSGTNTEGSLATTQRPGSMGGIIGGAVGGLTVLVVVVVVVAVVMKRRMNSGSEDPKPSSSHLHRPVLEKPGKAPKPAGSAAPPATVPEPTTLVRENNSAEGSHDQHTDNTYENTAKLSPAASRPLLIPQLHSIISAEISTFQKDSFKEEYLLIKAPALSCKVGRLPENVKRNRFKNIIAADETRVKLKVDEYNSDYVNANYIQDYHGQQRFIACQGPNDATLEDMWRLIHDSGTSTIVMLTNPVEATKKKCSVYWPDSSEVGVTFGKFKVTLIEEQMFAEYVVRKLKYTFNKVSRQVKQFHFTQWPDHGVPTTSGLLSFRHRVKQDMSASYKPAIIHCSAGVGRTGTFIGLDILIDEGKTTTAGEQDGTVDVMKSTASSKPRQLISPNAVSKENVEKNRDETVLPTERYCVFLPYISDSRNGYINAVYCDGYQNRRGFIVTQTPLTDTAEDFWHMTVDNKCPVIVYLNDCVTSHEVTLLEVKIADGRLLSTNQLTALCNKLEKYTAAGHPPITIQCLNGSRLSGILVIAMNLYLRARMEQEVDVVLEVKLARRSRPQFIADSESFDLLYEFVSSYLSDFNDYSNFR